MMLLQFSFENFKSFKQNTQLSLEASQDTSHASQVAEIGKDRILKTISIFGANAAGKSNLFLALTAAILTVRQSSSRQVGAPLPVIPFKFSEESLLKPTSFEFVFIAGDGHKYIYGFSATKDKVIKEYLYIYKTKRASTIFERTGSKYRFTNEAVKRELQPITGKNTENKLFLSTATEWNAQSTKGAFLWFQTIDTYSNNYESLIRQDLPMLEAHDEELRQFIRDTLKEADINISDYDYQSEEESTDVILSKIPLPVRPLVEPFMAGGKHKSYSITTMHQIWEHGAEKTYRLPLEEESQGTRSLFMLSPVLLDVFRKGKVLCIDEFDRSLHPFLVAYLISLFHNPDINVHHAQLIISSHTTMLLSRNLSRDDEIYFVDKVQKTGESELYSLDDFAERGKMDIRKAYLLGRFGAIPDIKGGELLW